MINARFCSRVYLLSGLLAASIGCASPAGPGRCRIYVVMQTSEQVNPSSNNEALPTTVRFYQLKDVSNLIKAGHQDLWAKGPEILGSDLADVQETVIFPADRQTQVLPIKDETAYLAVAAFFRAPEGVKWRTYARLPELGTTDRCREDRPGGPYYFVLDGTAIRGSREPPRGLRQ